MSKLLITSIGAGVTRGNGGTNYDFVEYALLRNGEASYCSSCYLAEALVKLENIDKLILFGTRTSDWDKLLQYLLHGTPVDALANEVNCHVEAAIKAEIEEVRDISNALSLCEAEQKLCRALQCAMKPGMLLDVILLTPGVNDKEISQNFRSLRRIEDHLIATEQNPISLYIDVTHSFRTHPMFELLFINYITDVRRLEHVNIEMVTYAMRDNGSNTVPILNVKRINVLIECMQAVEEFQRSGTVYKLIELQQSGYIHVDENTLYQLKQLTDAVYINRTDDFARFVGFCRNHMNVEDADGDEAEALVKQVFREIAETFTARSFNTFDGEMLTRYQLANWHCIKKRYLNGVIAAVEAMKVYALHLCDPTAQRSYANLKRVSDAMCSIGSLTGSAAEFLADYQMLRRLRNAFCHEGAYMVGRRMITNPAELGRIAEAAIRQRLKAFPDFSIESDANRDHLNELRVMLQRAMT